MPDERYRDPSQPLDVRVEDLLARMTLDEKIAQLAGAWVTDLVEDRAFSPAHARDRLEHGIGHITRVAAATGFRPAESAALANEIQRWLRDESRLGIPTILHEEACAGYMARDATCFPQAIGQASTFDPDLIQAMARVITAQMRAVGAHHALAPVLDITRDPRWGRLEETYGEDPYLVGRLGVAYIRGLQGDDLADGVIATAKHFLGYGLSEGGLNWAPVHLMPRELLDQVAWPFEAAIEEADVASVMNAYHELDGVPCGADRELMVGLLRERMGFSGVVVSDYFTIPMLVAYHRVAADKSEAARLALEAGIDVELPTHDGYGAPLRQALDDGRVDVSLVDASLRRLLEQKFRLGLFEDPFVDTGSVAMVFGTPDQRALAREMAEKSLVLLANPGGALPLRKDLASVAVIGPGADSVRLLQGDYHYPAHVEVMFEAQGNLPAPTPMLAPNVAELEDHYPEMTTILAGIRATVAAGTDVRHARGCDVNSTSTDGFAAAIAAAEGAEVAVVVVGDRSGLTDEATSGEARDRAELGLPGVQGALLDAVIETGTPVVVVLLGGRPLALPELEEKAAAILCAWLPGEEGGTAVADALFGDVNPGGKLPMTFPRAAAQIPVYYNHKPSGNRSHWKGDYVDMPTSPWLPFGHGLSYTTFAYEDLSVTPERVGADGEVQVALTVRNIGERAGDEVVQLYVRDPVGSVTRPVKELKGFRRIHVDAGGSVRVTFRLAVSQLGFHDRSMDFVVEPGDIEVMIGSSSADIRLQGTFAIAGDKARVASKAYFSHVDVA